MTSLTDVDLQRQWTWRCASSYTAVARVAQQPNVKLAQQSNVANTGFDPLMEPLNRCCTGWIDAGVKSSFLVFLGTRNLIGRNQPHERTAEWVKQTT